MTGWAVWRAWSCAIHLSVSDASTLEVARQVVQDELEAMDAAASRFSSDSELSRVNAAPGRPHVVSPLLAEAVSTALGAAAATDGLVDPALGCHLAAAGYDRDIDDVRAGATLRVAPRTRSTWRDIRLDGLLLTVPRGLALDLGATAKALTADRAAARVAARTGSSVLVAIGGDIAIAGPPRTWRVSVAECPGDDQGQSITAYDGGLATSSTLARRWVADGTSQHHLLDPRTRRPVDGPWRTATVAAVSCVAANTASTAALVLGDRAVQWLGRHRLPARLVDVDGRVRACGAWPGDVAA